MKLDFTKQRQYDAYYDGGNDGPREVRPDPLPTVIICDCHSSEHQLIFSQSRPYYKNEDNEIYMHTHLVTYNNWYKRLKYAIKYVFGYKSRYGAWDEVLISKQYAPKLREMADFLEEK